jgi:hypothetical protein
MKGGDFINKSDLTEQLNTNFEYKHEFENPPPKIIYHYKPNVLNPII